MSTAPLPAVRHTYGLPAGTVRGFMSVLICSFFWVVLLLPDQDPPFRAPVGHFVLLFMVFLAFASHHRAPGESRFLPWLMRAVFVGGSVAVIALVAVQHPERLQDRLKPDQAELSSSPGTMP
ncbi:MAG: hypothetical protein K2P78_06980 [Gemmataceae bacterium]|nr:hypothetical protein [Gemmataceae bacterium]